MDGQRKALIVANDEYEQDGLRRLSSAAADADALGRVLGDAAVGGFDVHVVRNEPSHVISSHIEDLFSDARRDDVLLLHFSCHGLKSESGELFFAATNTRPNRLGSTAVPAEFVQRCMRSSRSRSIVLLLDCCYGGAFSQGVSVRAAGDVNVLDSFPGGRLGGGRGRAVITASSAMEYAFEGDQLADDQGRAPSVFTAALVEGLSSGEADRDEDGLVSLNELYDYVFDRVRARNPNQTPSRDVEMQGELYVARSRRRRIRPQPIPAELRSAIADGNMFARLGAVTELRSRLVSDDLPIAGGAYEALREIASNDIAYVADAAAQAMRDVAIRVDPAELRLDVQPAVLRLLGPPLARECTCRASDDWISVAAGLEGVTVSADPAAAARQGSVTLTGPTGEVVVPVWSEARTPAPTAAASPVHQAAPPVQVVPEAAPAEALVAVPAPRSPEVVPPRAAVAARTTGHLRWVLVAVLVVCAAVLIRTNWPGGRYEHLAWADEDTGWAIYRRPWDPYFVASILMLATALGAAATGTRGRLALSIAAGSGLFLTVDGLILLLSGIGATEASAWTVTTTLAAGVAAAALAATRPTRGPARRRISPVAGGLVLAGGALAIAHICVGTGGVTWLQVTRGFGVFGPLMVVALTWVALAAGDPPTRAVLAGLATTVVVLAVLNNAESWSHNLHAAFVLGMTGYALVLAGLALGLTRPSLTIRRDGVSPP